MPETSPDERRTFILRQLKHKGRLTTGELAKAFGISEDSARRDFRELAGEGLIQRVHGAALPVSPAEQPFAARYKQSAGVKNRLAKEAASMVSDGQVVLFDGGTTNLAIATHIPKTLAFTAITNSPQTALVLADHPHAEVILIGGSFDKRSRMTVGARVLDALRDISADLCFFGLHGVDAEAGLTTSHYDEAVLKRAMCEAASETVAAATAAKIGSAAAYRIGPAALLTTLIVEKSVEPALCRPLSDCGISLRLA
ncbi:DeoR/GlpR family DNA-binding transcription regulator [Roseibium sp. M-1]